MSARIITRRDVYCEDCPEPVSVRIDPDNINFIELFAKDEKAKNLWGDFFLSMPVDMAGAIGRALIAAAAEAKQD